METFQNLTTSLLQIMVIAILLIGIWLIVIAGKTLVSAKSIRVQDIAIIAGILILILVAIRIYPAALMSSATDSIVAVTEESPAFLDAISEMVQQIVEPWQDGKSAEENPVIIDTNAPVTIDTPAPIATITPNTFEATATAYFGDFPTAFPAQPAATNRPMIQPTSTPRPTVAPTIDLSIWNPATPPPTPEG